MDSYSSIEKRTYVIKSRTTVLSWVLMLVSITQALGQQSDSLSQNIKKIEEFQKHELDSLPKLNADSLQLKIKLDSVSNRLNNSIDSLSHLKLPQEKYYVKMDSLFNSTQLGLNSKLKSGMDSLNAKPNELLNRYEAKLKAKRQRLDSLSTKYKLGATTGQTDVNVDFDPGELKMAGVDTPEFNKLEPPGFKVPGASIPSLNIPAVDNVKGELEQVTNLPGEAQQYSNKVEELKKTDLKEEAKKLPGELEEQAENLDQVKSIKKELPQTSAVTDQMKDLKTIADPASAKDEVKNRSKKALVDHFAGKDEVVKSGISKLEKYQKKYNSLADIRYLPKKRPNTMKGKPFIERVTPGIALRVLTAPDHWSSLDISPSVEYWFNDSFRAGIGGSYRIDVNVKAFEIEDRHHVYSFRAQGNYKLAKGFFAHVEGQALRTNKYLISKSPITDTDKRVWDYSVNGGAFKSYRISKQVRGTLVVLYDFSEIGKIFNLNQIAVRFGVEFILKKKKKSESSVVQ